MIPTVASEVPSLDLCAEWGKDSVHLSNCLWNRLHQFSGFYSHFYYTIPEVPNVTNSCAFGVLMSNGLLLQPSSASLGFCLPRSVKTMNTESVFQSWKFYFHFFFFLVSFGLFYCYFLLSYINNLNCIFSCFIFMYLFIIIIQTIALMSNYEI